MILAFIFPTELEEPNDTMESCRCFYNSLKRYMSSCAYTPGPWGFLWSLCAHCVTNTRFCGLASHKWGSLMASANCQIDRIQNHPRVGRPSLPVGIILTMLIDVMGRPILTVGGTIRWAG